MRTKTFKGRIAKLTDVIQYLERSGITQEEVTEALGQHFGWGDTDHVLVNVKGFIGALTEELRELPQDTPEEGIVYGVAFSPAKLATELKNADYVDLES